MCICDDTYIYAPGYDMKIKAERIDPKIERLDRQCTIYRNCCAGCCCVIIGIFIKSPEVYINQDAADFFGIDNAGTIGVFSLSFQKIEQFH